METGKINPGDRFGDTPLHCAAMYGCYDICETILKSENIVDKNPKNHYGQTPLHLAAILKQAGSSRYGKEDPGYLRRWVQMIFSTFFFLNLVKKTQDIQGGFSGTFNIFFNFAKKTQEV